MLAKRYELKYFIDPPTAAALRQELTPYMEPDPFCHEEAAYLVNSLYFDTPDMQFYTEKIDGQKYRHKIRLRTYGRDEDTVFLEMKKKINNCIYKVRASTARDNLRPYFVDEAAQPEELFSAGTCFSGVDEILALARRLRVRPTVGVCYRRRALMGKQDNRLRITFDEHIESRPSRCGLSLLEKGDLLFPPGIDVLEIKVDNNAPLWLVQIIEHFNLHRLSISKYCHAVARQKLYWPAAQG